MPPELLPEEIDRQMQLFRIIQKAFMLGVFVGKNTLTGMQSPQDAIEQAVNASIQNLNTMYPASDLSAMMTEVLKGIKLPE